MKGILTQMKRKTYLTVFGNDYLAFTFVEVYYHNEFLFGCTIDANLRCVIQKSRLQAKLERMILSKGYYDDYNERYYLNIDAVEPNYVNNVLKGVV